MQGPVAVQLSRNLRIYFAARQADGKSYPAYLDVDCDDPLKVIRVCDEPIMQFGALGEFDDEGIMPACAVSVEEGLLMYYSGWNRRVTVPYHNTTGIARSADGGAHFERLFAGPILDRTPSEPFMAVTPWVMRSGKAWRMWYVSGLGWLDIQKRQEPLYAIKYAESTDGINWRRDGRLTIPLRHSGEAIARPTVIKRDGNFHMWYCYRDSIDFRDGEGSYRIGYAFSTDGNLWNRADTLSGIAASVDGWDCKMQCYPYVIEVNDRLLLFYNGNSFGQTGIGCAVWEGDLPTKIALDDSAN